MKSSSKTHQQDATKSANPKPHQQQQQQQQQQPPSNDQTFMTGQFLHILRLLLRVKRNRCVFLIVVVLLLNGNLFAALISKHKNQSKQDIQVANSLKFYTLSDFAFSGARVLIDRTTFPAEAAAAAAMVSGTSGSTSWIKHCSPESACRAEFISERDPSVVAHFRYAKNNARRHILECFWVEDSTHRCAILYQLMVQSAYKEQLPQVEFENLQVFTLTDLEAEEVSMDSVPTNETADSICKKWTRKEVYSIGLAKPFSLITIGVSFYFLITTVSFIATIKAGGFYQQLVRSGLSVTCYWIVIWLVTITECLVFSALFVLSHLLPCPGVFVLGNIASVFLMVCVFFVELAALALLLEILIPSIEAVFTLLLIVSTILNIVFLFYTKMLENYSFIGDMVSLVHVKEYIVTYVTSGSSSGEHKSPDIVEHGPYDKMLGLNIATAIVLMLTITYVDFLLASGNGLRLPPYFFVIWRFWKPSTVDKAAADSALLADTKGEEVPDEPHIEPVIGATPSIIVDKVTKAYMSCPCLPSTRGPQILQQLSCKIYKNQITALIGHNGAGKSTLIKLLTGDENPDTGAAFIGGVKVTDPIERLALRGSISVCPQLDALCKALSVIECIQVTLTSKGVNGHGELTRARSMLNRLGLGDKENVMSTDLSGGQKRKVSTILALLGDPQVVFLDEPTSGLDPVSRRQLWQLLQEEKLGRSIVLCTQFMDEADILADRKIFLCGGNIVCAGSSMFLKQAFGCSFTITVSLKSERDAQKLLSRLKDVHLKSQFKTELQLEIPASKPNVLIAAVQVLEGASEVEAFGLSQASLDDVFMQLSGVSSTDVIDAFRSGNLSKLQERPTNSDAVVKVKEEMKQLLNQSVKVNPCNFVQFRAMLCVNLKKQWRTASTFWSRYVISVALLVIMAIFMLQFNAFSPKARTNNNSSIAMVDYLNNLKVDSTGSMEKKIFTPTVLLRANWLAKAKGLHVVCLRDEESPISSPLPVQPCRSLSLAGIGLDEVSRTTEMRKPRDEDLKRFLLKKSTRSELRKKCKSVHKACRAAHCNACMVYYASEWNDTNAEANSHRKIVIGMFIGEQKFKTSTIHAYRRAMNKIWWYFGVPGLEDSMAISHLRPLSQYYGQDFILILMVFTFCLFPVSYLSDPIDDSTSRVRNQLLSMGMAHRSYWTNLFSLHWVQYSVCLLISVGIVLIRDKYRHWQYIVYAIMPVMVFGTTSNQLIMYIIANVTRTRNTIVTTLCIIASASWSGISLLFSSNASVTRAFIAAVPPMAPATLIFNSLLPAEYTMQYYMAGSIRDTPGAFDNYWNHSYVFWPNVAMPVHAAALCGILILTECRTAIRTFLCSPKRPTTDRNSGMMTDGSTADQGTQNEYTRLMQTTQSSDNILEVRQLSKTYPNGVHAVRGVTFGVVSGEIFGLLGANGAGKSTSMSVIVGEDTSTGGTVQVRSSDGQWASGQSGAAMGVIGYCPQHNPLFDFLTVAEHLVLYAAIRGVPDDVAQRQADALIQGLGLQEHKDKLSRELSGGNKRRLCLAIALLGDPTLIVIDEASTGVDPENKRFIWGAIRSMLKDQRAVIVTTHSMEEVEALCNRVAIMNRGRLIAFGTVQQLRSQHGDAYTLDVLLVQSSSLQQKKSGIKSAVASQFKNAVLLEDLGLCMQFGVPKKSAGSLSDALKWLDANQSKLGMVSYSFCQMSLDQVFVKLVKQYDSATNEPA